MTTVYATSRSETSTKGGGVGGAITAGSMTHGHTFENRIARSWTSFFRPPLSNPFGGNSNFTRSTRGKSCSKREGNETLCRPMKRKNAGGNVRFYRTYDSSACRKGGSWTGPLSLSCIYGVRVSFCYFVSAVCLQVVPRSAFLSLTEIRAPK